MLEIAEDIRRRDDLRLVDQSGKELGIEQVQVLGALQHVLLLVRDAAELAGVEHLHLHLPAGKLRHLGGERVRADARVRALRVYGAELQHYLRLRCHPDDERGDAD